MTTDSERAVSGDVRCALSAAQLSKRRVDLRRLFHREALETRELPDGYAFRFPNDNATADRLLQFVKVERGCCDFLTYELTFEPNRGPIWLTLRGHGKAKAFIRDMLEQIGVALSTRG